MTRKVWLAGFFILMVSFSSGPAQSVDTSCPCCSEYYRQLDFWIGDWVVYANGQMVGFNKIVKVENGCALRENWKSVVSSHTGTSHNFYDKNLKKWHHVWVGNDGIVVNVKGVYEGNRMVMTSNEYRDEKGNRTIDRITWLNNADGTVRQTWEQSKDGGLAYTLLWDGLYRRRK